MSLQETDLEIRPDSKKSTNKYLKYKGNPTDIVTMLDSLGVDSSKPGREELARINNIPMSNNSIMNEHLATLLLDGKLLRK